MPLSINSFLAIPYTLRRGERFFAHGVKFAFSRKDKAVFIDENGFREYNKHRNA